MTSYTDTTLLNCNRTSSIEAKSDNNTNPAIFTNALQQTISLDVGDKISLEHAFVSEIGAGNSQTIEFKGSVRGMNKVSPYTNISFGDYFYKKSTTYDPNYRLGNYRSITTTLVENEEVELRDNLAPLIFGYYITSNEYPNYIQQPRRYTQINGTRGVIPVNPTQYSDLDSTIHGSAYQSINPLIFVEDDWIARVSGNVTNLYNQKVDNTRYTLFVKDFVAYSIDVDNAFDSIPNKFHNGLIAEATYLRVRERLDIEVNKGFNTPSAIGKQITDQFTETKNENTFNILDSSGYTRPITKTIENSTYKPINAQNLYNYCKETYDAYSAMGLGVEGNMTQLALDYVATFAYIAIKRPEIFEMGRYMNNYIVPKIPEIYTPGGIGRIPALTEGYDGFQTINDITIDVGSENTLKDIDTNIPYTIENLKIVRDFLDTQGYYNELWTSLPNSSIYNDDKIPNSITKDNSRFLHMNLYFNHGIEGVSIYNQTLGDDGYVQRATPNNINLSSLPIFFKWNELERDNFVEPTNYVDYATDGLMYGFAIPYKVMNYLTEEWYIKISVSKGSGIPNEFFTDTGNTTIKEKRRIGFDFHSTAYSTAIITPFSGYSNSDIGTLVAYTTNRLITNNSDTSNMMLSTGTTDVATDISPYHTQTYIGANTPSLEFNSINNRFEFAKLHTSNNVGNKLMAGCDLSSINNDSFVPPTSGLLRTLAPPISNPDAGDSVYKISPRPPQFGFSPTFKPYHTHNQGYKGGVYPKTPNAQHEANNQLNTNFVEKSNINIEPFAIFDSHGGIYIDNFGIDNKNWEDNLWDILGFNYDAIQAPPSNDNVLTQRVSNTNANALYRPTTNGEITTSDGKAYTANRFGANMYYTSLPYPINIMQYVASPSGEADQYKFAFENSNPLTGNPETYYPEIVIKTQSTSITATNLQKSVLKPYYTIRSSLLEGATAIGGNPTGAALPIISIIDKYSAQGDYFFGNPSNLQFTITRNTMIADITTSIHDPDGEFSNVDNTSAVIYKIQKLKPAPINIVEELLKKK